MKQTFIVVSDSTNIVSSQMGHIRLSLPSPIMLSGAPERYRLILEYMKIPYTVANISVARANNTFRYTYSATPYDITFPDGVYSAQYLASYIDAYQESQGHFYYTSYGEKKYYFNLGINNALGKCYFSINNPSTYPVTITFPTSTFYAVIGFLVGDSITATSLGTNHADISQSTDEIFLWCNIITGNYNVNIGNSQILYCSVWNGAINSYCQYPNVSETGQSISAPLNTTQIRVIEFKILDKNGAVMVFNTSNDSDNITIRFSITDESW